MPWEGSPLQHELLCLSWPGSSSTSKSHIQGCSLHVWGWSGPARAAGAPLPSGDGCLRSPGCGVSPQVLSRGLPSLGLGHDTCWVLPPSRGAPTRT